MVLLQYFRDGAVYKVERFENREIAEVKQKQFLLSYPDHIQKQRQIKATICNFSKNVPVNGWEAFKQKIFSNKSK